MCGFREQGFAEPVVTCVEMCDAYTLQNTKLLVAMDGGTTSSIEGIELGGKDVPERKGPWQNTMSGFTERGITGLRPDANR